MEISPFFKKDDRGISSQPEPPHLESLFLLPAMREVVDSHCSTKGVDHLVYLCERNNHLYHNLIHYAVQATIGTFGTKHGGRCLHIDDPAVKTL